MKLSLIALCSTLVVSTVNAHTGHHQHQPSSKDGIEPLFYDDGVVNLDSLSIQLSSCQVVQDLNIGLLENELNASDKESYVEYIFSKLFPFGPAGNSLLATSYISGPPNFILALIPADIDVSSLSLLVSFAIGGLLGDVFLHLLPQTFLGEPLEESASFVLVDGKRNCLLGFFIFIGFLIFFIIDKSLRILEHTGDGEGHSHSHSHSHSHANPVAESSYSSSVEAISSKALKNRKSSKEEQGEEESFSNSPVIAKPSSSVKTSAYLNLISDFSHNITDGLAIATSFYISKHVGCTTTLAVFFHEIPHEVGDFALLIQGGFTKWQAMNSQFLTAVGAFLGTFIGIAIQTYDAGLNEDDPSLTNVAAEYLSGGIMGTTVKASDLTLPFTAGGFLYIGFSVVPELLEMGQGTSRKEEFIKFISQIFFVFVGIGFMFLIAWNE